MADRKAELEKKRQKLEELKKAREQKKKETQDKELVSVTAIIDIIRLVMVGEIVFRLVTCTLC